MEHSFQKGDIVFYDWTAWNPTKAAGAFCVVREPLPNLERDLVLLVYEHEEFSDIEYRFVANKDRLIKIISPQHRLAIQLKYS